MMRVYGISKQLNSTNTYHADLAQETEGVESLLWSLSAAFHNGDLTQDEAIEAALSSGYSRNELIEMYNLLTSQDEQH